MKPLTIRKVKPPLIPNSWDEERLYFDGDVFFAELIQAIDSARIAVELETYIFDSDAIGEKIENALERATSRGIKTRLLVDGIGSLTWINSRLERLAKTGVEIRVFHPVHYFPFSRTWSRLSRLNRRTHRKMCLIDDSTALVGSLNISASHSFMTRGQDSWHDTATRVSGAGVKDLKMAFEYAWRRSRLPDGSRHWIESLQLIATWRLRSQLVRLNFTSRIRRRNFRAFIKKIRSARSRIYITNAYLSPSRPVISALNRAARRGVDVRILVPRKSDVFFMPWVATSYYPRFLKSGVRIYEFLPRFLHAKSVIIDDWATVGTSNLNRRSLLHDLEVDVVLSHPASIEELKNKFEENLSSAEEIRRARGGLTAWLGRLVTLLFRYWI